LSLLRTLTSTTLYRLKIKNIHYKNNYDEKVDNAFDNGDRHKPSNVPIAASPDCFIGRLCLDFIREDKNTKKEKYKMNQWEFCSSPSVC
jgi:hypothetical protein